MTAINVIRHRASVHMLTDGGIFDADGIMVSCFSKVLMMPHLNAVISCRGSMLALSLVAAQLGVVATTYDGMKALAVDTLWTAWATLHGELFSKIQIGDNLQIVVAGISETKGPDSFIILSRAEDELEAWTLIPLGECFLSPSSDEIYQDFSAAFPPGTTADEIDPERDGVRILEMQRKRPLRTQMRDDVKYVVSVGGFAQLTTVALGYISTRVIHRWQVESQRGTSAAKEVADA
jgi:hypothetical protein